MTAATSNKKRFAWVGSVTGLFAVAACYGTLASVALLSLIGINIDIDEGLMMKIISGLMLLVLAGMGYSYIVHRHVGPLLLSIASAALLLWVFYGSYSKPLEMTGFAVLMIASVWDFRLKNRACPAMHQACGK